MRSLAGQDKFEELVERTLNLQLNVGHEFIEIAFLSQRRSFRSTADRACLFQIVEVESKL